MNMQVNEVRNIGKSRFRKRVSNWNTHFHSL